MIRDTRAMHFIGNVFLVKLVPVELNQITADYNDFERRKGTTADASEINKQGQLAVEASHRQAKPLGFFANENYLSAMG